MPDPGPEIIGRAAALGLVAWEASGFCHLSRPGETFAARGGTWEECFARLAPPEPDLDRQPIQRDLWDQGA